MTGGLGGSNLESAALSRLYFLGPVDPSERGPDEHLDTVDVPEGLADVAAHQRATLDYGIASLRFALERFRAYADRDG